jgi:glycosyltransferase involved in cell wall biosynthesis
MEGFGIVAIEAAATGLPVAASNIEGIRDAVIENQSGKIFPNYNTNKALLAIKGTMKLSRNRVLKTAKKFSWVSVSEKYLSYF